MFVANDEEACPYCDSLNYTQIGTTNMFCRDCGEKWVEDVRSTSVS